MDIEQQWMKFMNEDYNENELQSYDVQLSHANMYNKDCIGETDSGCSNSSCKHNISNSSFDEVVAPSCSPLSVSTKTKIIYLNSTFNLNELFWKLKITHYDSECEGIVKKQMKFNFTDPNQVKWFEDHIKHEKCVNVKVLNQINNPSGRVTFKDVRKVDIGFSRNDVLNPKKQSKSAFYNCLVMIFRKKVDNIFQEYHVKLFNSGKVEVPGIQSEQMLDMVVDTLLHHIRPYHENSDIFELKEMRELILVNSNFSCNYYLNREKLVHILKQKYKIKCGMDSCSYPGIQCKYKLKNGSEISFMIFRTGSVLIVGKCEDDELNDIYMFLCDMFEKEHSKIVESESMLEREEKMKNKLKKKGRRTMYIYKTQQHPINHTQK
jgi:TATA-box binding protein (TBP) (component of TFIID and TFIIIB)